MKKVKSPPPLPLLRRRYVPSHFLHSPPLPPTAPTVLLRDCTQLGIPVVEVAGRCVGFCHCPIPLVFSEDGSKSEEWEHAHMLPLLLPLLLPLPLLLSRDEPSPCTAWLKELWSFPCPLDSGDTAACSGREGWN